MFTIFNKKTNFLSPKKFLLYIKKNYNNINDIFLTTLQNIFLFLGTLAQKTSDMRAGRVVMSGKKIFVRHLPKLPVEIYVKGFALNEFFIDSDCQNNFSCGPYGLSENFRDKPIRCGASGLQSQSPFLPKLLSFCLLMVLLSRSYR